MADFEKTIREYVGEDGNIPATAINAIVTAIKQAVGNEYVEKERYKAKLTEIDTLKEQQQTAEDSAATAEKWKTKYEEVKTQFEDYKVEQEQKAVKAEKEAALTELLKDMGMSEKGIRQVLKWQGVDGVELNDDGKISNAKDLRKSIKEDWGDHIQTQDTQGAQTQTPPANMGGGAKTAADILNITDREERRAAMRENPELFGL